MLYADATVREGLSTGISIALSFGVALIRNQ